MTEAPKANLLWTMISLATQLGAALLASMHQDRLRLLQSELKPKALLLKIASGHAPWRRLNMVKTLDLIRNSFWDR